MSLAEALVSGAGLWGMLGAGVALVFLTVGIERVDEDARGTYLFRVLLIPGVLVIWPLVLWRWAVLARDRDRWQARYLPPRQAHFPVACVLAGLICATLLAGVSLRQTWPGDIAPERVNTAEAGG